MSLSPPAEIKSKFFMLAELTAAEGKGDEMQKHLAIISQAANSSKEPNTLFYRPSRGVGAESNKFTVIEEYADKKALDDHLASDEFKAFTASGCIGSVSASFREGF